MASYHCSVKVGSKGKAGPHASYISREGKYEKTRSNEKLEHVESGNMPKWAEKDPAQFWQAADQHERANGATYREIEVALPRELTPAQRVELVRDMVDQELGDKHAFTWAIHNPLASLEGGEQPHAHIMYSERTIDGIDRDPDQYFKRYNAKNPEKGGCRKDSAGTEERLQATRERWANVQNLHLEQHGHEARVDHRSLKDQGIERTPEPHFGPGRIQRMTVMQDAELAAVLERRAAEGEHERAQHQVSSLIDLSGDLAAAKADRTRQQAVEAQKRAVDASAAVVVSRYAQALENVTSETLATVPGLLPAPAIKQAIKQVVLEVQAESQVQEIDVNEVGRQVLAQPALQQRLQQVREKEARAKATLDEVADMGFFAGKWNNAQGKTEAAHKLQAEARDERAQILADIEQSSEVQAVRKANRQAKQARDGAPEAVTELGQILMNVEQGQALHQRQANSYNLPEVVGRVVNKARAIAPNSLQGMQLADVERMTAKAAEFSWIKPEGVNPHLEKVSRFVVPREQRVQQLQRSQERGQGPRLG